ncbi:OprD family outer membrane porin [Endozoicomonas arenosclerae]|uniref:OprD family outer membrane porin n=1 Tax=Endozoicomonas arenosclerae TaxID=1633495 RepID=UPI000ABE2CD1|nr:OprD family outer membrane porin [Endozoicomonas arenosclerae]
MKLAQISALSAAIFMATSAQANAFLDDSSLNLELVNYSQTKTEDTSKKYSTSQWAQGIKADFSSGYFENIVGLDFSAYYSLKLGASHADFGNPGLLKVDSDGESHSYGKTAYAIKFNLADMGEAKYGRMFISTPLYGNSSSRVLPGLSEGFYADISVAGLSAHTAWIQEINKRAESGFDDFEADGDKQAVKIIGGSYDFGNGLQLSADYGTQTDFAKKYLTEISYSTELQGVDLGVAGQYAKFSSQGYLQDALKADPAQDTSQYAYGLKVTAGIAQANFGIAYTKVESSDATENFIAGWQAGTTPKDMAADDSYFGYNSIQISDFNTSGQKAWGFTAGYDFAEFVDGLTVEGIYVIGDTKTADETEYNIDVNYAIPQVEGLTARLRYAKNTVDPSGSGDDTVTTDTRIILKYNIAVF